MLDSSQINKKLLPFAASLALLLLLGYLWWQASTKPHQQVQAVAGIIDLSNTDIQSATISLDGDWRFTWRAFVSSMAAPEQAPVFMRLPGVWNGFRHKDETLPAHGYGSYQLDIVLGPGRRAEGLALYIPFVHSSHALFVDGQQLAADGSVAATMQGFAPGSRTLLVPLRGGGDTIRITLHVANFAYAMGGVWQSPRIGALAAVQSHYDKQLAFDLFIFGGLLIMSVYHIALYFLRRRIRSNLFFGLLCFFLAIKNLFSGVAFFYTFWPGAPYELGLKLIHISIFGAAASLWFFLRELYTREFRAWVGKILLAVCVAGTITTFVFPSRIYSALMIGFWVLAILVMLFIIRGIYLAVFRKQEGALLILAGLLCFLCTVLHDLAIDFKLINGVYLSGAGFFIFIFSQALLLAVKFTRSFQKVEHLTQDIMNTNRSYSRFVPSEFLSYLNKHAITEVELGDHLQGDMTVFFCDIRSYTSLSENMSPKTNFAFINDYLGRVVQFIEQQDGLVNQYLGDGILALFMERPEDAVKAAVRIQRDISSITELGGYQLKAALENGIGIHSGTLILGMLGTAQRMSIGVISDTVNTASRIEGLTKYFGAQVIISESTLGRMEDRSAFAYRSLGKVQVKGKHDVLRIYEVLDGLPDAVLRLKMATRNDFEAGLESYFRKEFTQAVEAFRRVLDIHDTDRAAQIYLGNAALFLKEGVDAAWKGELRMEIK
jgi:adenylate cyclase